jgi:hypothetical protein
MELITVDTILDFLKENIEKKMPISPAVYVDAAAKLNVLLSDEHAILHKLQREIAQEKVKFIETDMTSSESKVRVEALPLYEEMLNQKAKIERIVEFIRISKLQARMVSDELRSGF